MPRVVISASRRTDIPAFYMPWFMNAIARGHFKVHHPYSRRITKVAATPERVHTIVFWSKNFGPFLSRGDGERLMRMGYTLFFNFTINSSHPVLEPRMPALEDRLDQLAQLSRLYGPECIQWRFDPICFFRGPTGQLENNLNQFDAIARRAADAGVRVCITSFVDLYRKVLSRIKIHSNLELIDPPLAQKVALIEKLSKQLSAMDIDLMLCCEKEVLAAMPAHVPVTASACIPNDRLMALYGTDISLARDFGQRTQAGCQCRVSKDVGSYALHPCGHNCLFCYANPKIDKG